MTATLVYERINNRSCAFPLEELKSTYGKSYYKFYQLRLRQLLTENRSHQEHDGKYSKQKQSKTSIYEKRTPREYMNHLREKIKTQSENDDYGKRASSVVGLTNRRTKDSVTFTVTTTDISTTNSTIQTETRPKSIIKMKQSSFSEKRQRVASAPANSQKHLHKKRKIKIPTIEIDDDDDDNNLPKSNAYSYTQISSSSQNHIEKNNQYARKLTLNTIMLHLHSYAPPDISKWNLYRDLDEKFSASISPRVYRNFERIIL